MKLVTNINDENHPENDTVYPVSVYLNGKIVGTMDSRGAVTITDQSAVETVMKMMDSSAVGLSSRDSKGNVYKDGGIHFTTLGNEEDAKMEHHRIAMQRKKGRIL